MRYNADLDRDFTGHTVNAKLQRNNRDGMILGICAGIADYTGWSLFWIRVAFVISLLIFNGMAVLAYLVAAVLMPLDLGRILPRRKAQTQYRRHHRYQTGV